MVVSNIFLEFSPRMFGEMIQFDEHIFQNGLKPHETRTVLNTSQMGTIAELGNNIDLGMKKQA